MVIEVVKPDGQVNIMVVEDNNYLRNLVVSLLIRQDYNIVSASNAFEAMDLAVQYGAKFLDLMIIDYKLPDINGINFMRELKLKKDFHAVPAILLSQYNDQFFMKNNINKDVSQMFSSVIHKTDIYKFLVKEVKILLDGKKRIVFCVD
jgi:response regulator RpfG family c-di-GMP phosphodiesterase